MLVVETLDISIYLIQKLFIRFFFVQKESGQVGRYHSAVQ